MVATSHPLLEALERTPRDGHRRDIVWGRLIDMPPAWPRSGRIAFKLGVLLENFQHRQRLPYTVFGADAGFRIADPPEPGLPPHIVSPDVTVVANRKLPADEPPGFWPLVPDLVVEVMSPSDSLRDTRDKIRAYLHAGVSLVWIVVPRARTANVYTPGQPAGQTLRDPEDTLDGADVLPGFSVTLRELFERS